MRYKDTKNHQACNHLCFAREYIGTNGRRSGVVRVYAWNSGSFAVLFEASIRVLASVLASIESGT